MTRYQFDRSTMTDRELLLMDALTEILNLANAPHWNAERKNKVAAIAFSTIADAKYNKEYNPELKATS